MNYRKLLLSSVTLMWGCLAFSQSQPIMTWKPDTFGCDERYIDGVEQRGMSTDHAFISVALIPADDGMLDISLYIANPQAALERFDVIPQNVHLFKVTAKGSTEIKRNDASKMARSKEHHSRIVQGIAAGLSSASSRQTTGGTVIYGDGSTGTYSATSSNPTAQSEAINRAHRKIGAAQAEGAYLVSLELKRNTVEPGNYAMGRLFFPRQKDGEDLLVQLDIGDVRYEIPFQLPRKR